MRLCLIDNKPLSSTQSLYCSKACGAKGTKPWLGQGGTQWWCVVCGDEHKRRRSPYCSVECRRENRRQQILAMLIVGPPKSKELKKFLVEFGLLEAKYEWCGLDEWRGRSGLDGPLQLDHINGNAHDNRLENLRILCANCHTQTDTYCGKNKGNGARSR